MTTTMMDGVPSETARIREVYRYLDPHVLSMHPHSLKSAAGSKGETAAGIKEPRGCDDTALAAFAQIGALRLSSQRCMISLVSKDVEYILAESTRTLSLQVDNVHNDRDALWLGTSNIPRSEGITTLAMEQWHRTRSETREKPETSDFYYPDSITPHWAIVSDVREHGELLRCPLVQHAQNLRFYCAVPIRNPSGILLGSYAIMDDKPRYGISASEMEFLEDIADTIVSHLSARIANMQREKGDRLVKGLALFSGGMSSLRDWWYTQQPAERGHGHRRRGASNDQERKLQDRAEEEFGQTYRAEELDARGRMLSKPSGAKTTRTRSENGTEEKYGTQSKSASTATSLPGADDEISLYRAQNQQDEHSSDIPPWEGGKAPVFNLARQTADVYSRASNLIRESMRLEGVIFADATFVNSLQETPDTKEDEEEAGHGTTSGSDDNHHSDDPEKADHMPAIGRKNDQDPYCSVLGYSTKVRSTLRGFGASQNHSLFSKKLMKRLIKRYPNGRVFSYHDNKSLSSTSGTGSGSSGTESSELTTQDKSRKPRRKSKSMRDAARLAHIIPDARSIAILPLWDGRRDQYRASVIVWNQLSDHFLEFDKDVTYLAAFCNSISAELTRLDTVAADQAKTTFISSVSHELRSPLHGVLAGVEFLQESKLSSDQQEMVDTVSLTAKTLLDTINNILDFSKISNFTDGQRRDRRDQDRLRDVSFKSDDVGEIGVTTPLDLAELTENVVDTIASTRRISRLLNAKRRGQTHGDSGSNSGSNDQCWNEHDSDDDEPGDSVKIALNIAPRASWGVVISPGSWTRILTNLIGNSIKYTTHGLITVNLTYNDTSTPKSGIQLIVEDTGQGISQDYLKYRLFTAFAQENSHAAGTGLGMSIIKQIVDELHGHIEVESEVGKGTKVMISITRRFDDPGHSSLLLNALGPIHLLNDELDRGPVVMFLPSGGKSGSQRYERPLKARISETFTEWLRCTSTGLDNRQPAAPDVIVLAEDELSRSQLRRLESTLQNTSQDRQGFPPMIVLRALKEAHATDAMRWLAKHNVIFVTQPFGPRKMHRALQAALDLSRSKSSRPSGKDHGPSAIEIGPSTTILDRTSLMRHNASRSAADDSDQTNTEIQPSRIPPKQRSEDTSADVASTSKSQPLKHRQYHESDPPVRGKVLLVEDNSVNMKFLVTVMRKNGFPYEQAENGLEAVQKYSDNPESFSLILMDISMPIKDGFAATVDIRDLEEKENIRRCPIIALTGVGSDEASAKASAVGMDRMLTKPVRMSLLKEIVQRVLEDETPKGTHGRNRSTAQ